MNKPTNKIYIIGIGPGHPDYVLPIAHRIIMQSDLLIGGERNLETFPDFNGRKIVIKKDLAALVELMKQEMESKEIALIVSGDTGFYSMLSYMKKHFTEEEIEVIAGISSVQYLFAKIKEPWQQVPLMSLHGRREDFITALKEQSKVALLTDQKHTPDEIARELIQEGLGEVQMVVGENLSYEEERLSRGTPEEIISLAPYQMSVVVIKNE
ncbi:precorrin-6y C5,15-methyltransferase (decarboxylating) subunit CbiE [Alkaliphilus hydrothermalis]|uniref:Cobalt-precorrin-7 (C5)-methyltransferase n=1 Tax=Alkaliphilus hydrothermalis TaxID=1482730 RepID=A0ABS2NQ41_9FIRM|nr:precorrin-6y C5,15-methyltransferase (decarboxylating) subunit CbiE [Alkaliphilus hydrothermalis]MBM7614724.1 cobalt-precorrin-7 (C5)-methyltransferase [Alkaliphilus hydrothermalis]